MEQRPFGFGGIPVYNPQSLSKEEAHAQFLARKATFSNLLDILHEEHPSHVLIIGTRGMGKTTLLQRVRYGVEEDPDLSGRFIVLVFPEEQYNVNRLHRFLLNALDALADAMEHLKDREALKRIESYIETISQSAPEEIEEGVPKFLGDLSKQLQKSFLLLVDNADRLIETIPEVQQWQLRNMLSSRHDITFFGATTQASEGIYGSTRAFFEFFHIVELVPLKLYEVRDLLIQLGDAVEKEETQKGTAKVRIVKWLDADATRLETLVQLTGGNPRTTVLLFHLVLDGLDGGAREYLEQLLDQVTPNYKGRVDELPAQAQQVLDAVALQWDPITAMEVGKETGLETNAVSTQLTRLVRQGILEKADPGDSKKAMYQVAERFFNIWYLMRASRRVRAKLRWFVEFLRVFFDAGHLDQMARSIIVRSQSSWRRHPEELETAFAYALASGAARDGFEDFLQQKCSDTEEIWRPYLELLEFPKGRIGTVVSAAEEKSGVETDAQVRSVRKLRVAAEEEPEKTEHWMRLGNLLAKIPDRSEEAEAAYRKALALEPTSARTWNLLGDLLAVIPTRFAEAEAAYRKAIALNATSAPFWVDLGKLLLRMGDRSPETETACRNAIALDPNLAESYILLSVVLGPDRFADAEVACLKAIELGPESASPYLVLGGLLSTQGRFSEAEAACRKAVALKPNFGQGWALLGLLLAKVRERHADAEAAYAKAIELDPANGEFWDHLGDLLAQIPERRVDAEAAYAKAIELDPASAEFRDDLGDLLAQIPERRAEAEVAYTKAIELDPSNADFQDHLGDLLAQIPERLADAEAAYTRAIELNPNSPQYYADLCVILARMDRLLEAETVCREAIERDPNFAGSWSILSGLLVRFPERFSEAESACRKAIELAPSYAGFWSILGDLLATKPARFSEAEAAFRKAIELDPADAGRRSSLGDLLVETPERFAEAEANYRAAIELDPADAEFQSNLGNLLVKRPERLIEGEAALRKAIELNPADAIFRGTLGDFLAGIPTRLTEAEVAYREAIGLNPATDQPVNALAFFLACKAGRPRDAEVEFRNALKIAPENPQTLRNLGVLLYCELEQPEEAATLLRRAYDLEPSDSISAAILAAVIRNSAPQTAVLLDESPDANFWRRLLPLCENYPPFGKIFNDICEIVLARDALNPFARLHRAVALAQLRDFPRASVALEDALIGNPLELLRTGRSALEVFLAAAVRSGRVQDCLELIDRKGWRDAWRPVYEALEAVESGSAEYLKRIAVEIRRPTLEILRSIAPQLPDFPERIGGA